MPPRQNVRTKPLEYLRGGTWPDAELEPYPPAVFAQVFSRNLRAVVGSLSLREVGRRAELNARTVQLLLTGQSWPDMVSVSKLEAAFGQLLWPRDSERLLTIRALRGDDPVTPREVEFRRLMDAADALETAWETFRSEFRHVPAALFDERSGLGAAD